MSNTSKKKKQYKEIQEDIRKLVIERIKTISDDLRVSVGFSSKGYTKDKLIASIKKGDKIGQEIVDAQMKMKAFFQEG